ncbi:MAG: Mov34/MPN/PAD-1 family protein [Candidatus Izemoplasmataceae bacterium]
MYTIVEFGVLSIYVKNDVMAKLINSRQKGESDPETGGMIFGKVTKSGTVLYIESISEAHSEDMHSRYEYIRSIEHALSEIEEKVVLGGYITYLGEWHTHPCHSFVSEKDMKSHKRLNKTTKKFISGLVIIVVGNEDDVLFAFLDKKDNLYERKVILDV